MLMSGLRLSDLNKETTYLLTCDTLTVVYAGIGLDWMLGLAFEFKAMALASEL